MKNICIFCGKKLKKQDGKYLTWCVECGASWVPECPKCKKPTWMSLEGIYTHPSNGCGYIGKKL
jgi:hypothetical protein